MKNLKLNFVQKFVMKICVFTALVASSSAIGLKDQAKNPHLTATYILNDALSMVDQIATKSRNEESKTNTDYVKELDRRIKDITWERKHVQDGEVQATTMLHGGNLTQEDKDRIAAENKFVQEELAAQAANIKAEEEAKLQAEKDRIAQEEADKKALEEAEKKAKEAAEQKARDEAEKARVQKELEEKAAKEQAELA